MNQTMPSCQEDQVLIGSGDFSHGTWTAFTCGPAVDNYLPDTGMKPADAGLDIGLGAILIGAMLLSAARRWAR